MPKLDGWSPGDWNIVCSMCGRKRKASFMVKNWQGLWRCPEHNEERHPQDYVKGTVDNQTVPFAQLPADIDTYLCTLNSQLSLPSYGIPGCMVPGRTGPINRDEPVYPTPTLCDEFGIQAIPGFAQPGCAIPGEDVFAP